MMDSLMSRNMLKNSGEEDEKGEMFKKRRPSKRRSSSHPVKKGQGGTTPKSPLSSKQSLSKFWDDGGDVVDRRAAALEAHKQRARGKASSQKTLSAYKVKYTVMSKDSKHFLELVIQKLCHCWRRKQALDLLRCFNLWVRTTLSIDLQSARAIKALRKEVKTANERVSVFVEALIDGDEDEERLDNMTPQEAEELLRERWQRRVEMERATRKRNMKKMISLFKHKSLYRCYVNWKNYTLREKAELALKLKSSGERFRHGSRWRRKNVALACCWCFRRLCAFMSDL